MTQTPDRENDVRTVLIEAVEVQLAALKAAMTFWGEWIERTSAFVKTATRDLDAARSAKKTDQVLLELVDAGREGMRTLTELPRHAAEQFVRDLDEIAAKGRARTGPASRSRAAGPGRAPSPARAGRAAKRRVRAKG
jgi:hypothetical protein